MCSTLQSASNSCVRVCSDYRHMPELDRYDADGIDENENLEELSDGGRLAVEEELDRRDRRARGDLPAAFEGAPATPRSCRGKALTQRL